jgi:hypothetical protein
MPPRLVRAVFDRVEPVYRDDGVGVELGFLTGASRIETDRIDDFADLGPEITVPAVAGIGKVLRILRAARISAPREPHALAGRVEEASALLTRALGCRLQLEVRPRSRVHFTAWTESGVETVSDVADVVEGDTEYLIMRRGGRFPVRFARDAVVRRITETERWFEVIGVERAGSAG